MKIQFVFLSLFKNILGSKLRKIDIIIKTLLRSDMKTPLVKSKINSDF